MLEKQHVVLNKGHETKYIWRVILSVAMNIPPEISASKALLFFCDNLDEERQWGKAVDALKEMDHMQKAQTWMLMANKAAVNNNNNNAVLSKYKCAYKRAVREAEEGVGSITVNGGGRASFGVGHLVLHGGGGGGDFGEINDALVKSIELCRLFHKTYEELVEGHGVASELMEHRFGGGEGGSGISGKKVLQAGIEGEMETIKAKIDEIGTNFEKLKGEDKRLEIRMDQLDRECKTRGENNALKFGDFNEVHARLTSRMDQFDNDSAQKLRVDKLKFSEFDKNLDRLRQTVDVGCVPTLKKLADELKEISEISTLTNNNVEQLDQYCNTTNFDNATKFDEFDDRIDALENKNGTNRAVSGAAKREKTSMEKHIDRKNESIRKHVERNRPHPLNPGIFKTNMEESLSTTTTTNQSTPE